MTSLRWIDKLSGGLDNAPRHAHLVYVGPGLGNATKIFECDSGAGEVVVDALTKAGDISILAEVIGWHSQHGQKMLGKVDTDLNSQSEIVMSDHKHQCYMSSPSQTDPPLCSSKFS